MPHHKILYVHGLGSSSQSTTAMQLKTNLPKVISDSFDIFSPDIPELPSEAIPFIETFVHHNLIDLVVGSSLGGFKVLNAQFSSKVNVLVINPVVDFKATYVEMSNSLHKLYIEGIELFEKHKLCQQAKMKSSIIYAFIAESDEVLNSKLQAKALNKYYLKQYRQSELKMLPNEVHKLSEKSIQQFVCPAIADILYSSLHNILQNPHS